MRLKIAEKVDLCQIDDRGFTYNVVYEIDMREALIVLSYSGPYSYRW
jgi:hypothetical protein